jgi:hypothetical protein
VSSEIPNGELTLSFLRAQKYLTVSSHPFLSQPLLNITQHLWLMDPDPSFFISDLQDGKKNFIVSFCSFNFEDTFTSIFKDKES